MIRAFQWLKSLKFFSREIRGMHQAAYLLAAFSLGSQLLALVRDRLLAAAFGAGHTLDLYYAAFRLPDFLFATIASLFSLYALLPVLSRLEAEREGTMIPFLRDMLWIFFLGMSFISMIAYILTPALAPLIAPGIAADPASLADLIFLMRILLLQPIFLGASNTIAALTQLRHRFVLYSVSPLLYNLGIIFGATVLYPIFGVEGLGYGVVFGAFMHMIVQVPYFIAEKSEKRLPIQRVIKDTYEVLTLSIPRTFALAANQISLLAIVALASIFSSGSIAVFTFAYNLQSVPLTIIGVSYSIAAFPTLAHLHAMGKQSEFNKYVEAAVRHIIFWSIPAIVFVIVLRAQLVRVILGAGQFDWNATRLTAAALALFVVSLTAQSITLLMARAYYATGNTRKPLYYGFVDIFVSIISAVLLVLAFDHCLFFKNFVESLLRVGDVPGTDVLMLAFGYALGAIAECAVGFKYFGNDFAVSPSQLSRLFFESSSAAILGGAVSYLVLSFFGAVQNAHTTMALVTQGTVAGTIGLITTAGVLFLLKNREFLEAYTTLVRRFKDTPRVAVEPSDVS